MSSGTTSVMTYKWNGDSSQAVAALQELRARLSDTNRESMKFAREAIRGNEGARQSLLEAVQASDKYKGKIQELTTEVQRFQQQQAKGGAGGGMGGMFALPSMQQLQGALTGVAFGLDDFIQQYGATGRLSDAIRAAGNNLTMLASLFGPVAVVATAAGTAVAGFWAKSSERADDSIEKAKEYKKTLEELSKLEARTRVSEDQEKLTQAGSTVLTAERKEREAQAEVKRHEELGPFSADLGNAREALVKAREDVRKARVGKDELEQQIATKQAATALQPAKDDMRRIYQDARARGLSPEQAQQEVTGKLGGMAQTPMQQKGLQGVVKELSGEVETDIAGKQLAKGLEDPNVARKREMQQKVEKDELALHQMEREAQAEARGMNRKGIARDDKAQIDEQKELIQLQRDQLKALETLIENTKREKEAKILNLPIVPKGLGEAGR